MTWQSNLEAGMQAWFYDLEGTGGQLLAEHDYLGSVEDMHLNADWAAALFEGVHSPHDVHWDHTSLKYMTDSFYQQMHSTASCLQAQQAALRGCNWYSMAFGRWSKNTGRGLCKMCTANRMLPFCHPGTLDTRMLDNFLAVKAMFADTVSSIVYLCYASSCPAIDILAFPLVIIWHACR